MKNPKDKAIKTFHLNWLDEMQGAATYRALASEGKDESRKAILFKMAEAEERHASRWAQRIEEAGEKVPAGEVKPLRAPLLALRVADLNAALRQVERDEHKDIRKYASQAGVLTDEASQTLLKEVKQDEEEHARILEVMTGPLPRTRLESILRREKWHVSTGSWIGDAIYGVNDGLGAVFGIVSGVSGATGGSRFVLVSGLAGMLASALSMGSSAYLASKSEREVHESELAKEKREISEHPEEELEELELFYQLKGLAPEEAKLLASRGLPGTPRRCSRPWPTRSWACPRSVCPGPGPRPSPRWPPLPWEPFCRSSPSSLPPGFRPSSRPLPSVFSPISRSGPPSPWSRPGPGGPAGWR